MVSSEEIVLGDLPAGIVRADEAVAGRVWNVLGHTYITKAESALPALRTLGGGHEVRPPAVRSMRSR